MATTYSEREVRFLVEGYEELEASVDTRPGYPLRCLLQLVDLRQAIAKLDAEDKRAFLLCGPMGMPVRDAAGLLGVSASTAHRSYSHALQEIAVYINGGT